MQLPDAGMVLDVWHRDKVMAFSEAATSEPGLDALTKLRRLEDLIQTNQSIRA